MIIAQDVLRLLTVKALRGRTWVGNRVFDSPAQPADLKLDAERAAYIGVYVDDADVAIDGDALMSGDAVVQLIIEIAVAENVTVNPETQTDQDPSDPDIDRVPSAPAQTAIVLAQTDEAMEMTIGFVSRQVLQALNMPDNPWGELWRQMTSSGRDKVEIRRGGPGQNDDKPPAIRYASKVLRFFLHVCGEPAFREGVSTHPGDFWPRFLNAAAGDSELAGIAAIVREHFEGAPGLPSWRVEQTKMSMTQEALVTMGITPLIQVIPDEAEPPELVEVEHEESGTVYLQTVPPGGPTI